ncbi:DUF6597 domain-containing transcriptional factor [Winogradskyella sp. 3972H.M.0a.05]|uniref:AraC family transcriptional regulator n=1 Tax=Winogradskyella sp. 3972H.M.0a.05 TaxID=2950277 RepID=UPI0033945F53
MKFEQYHPSEAFQNIIAYYWTLKTTEKDFNVSKYRFVPDGYVDWVFHLGTPWQCNFSGKDSNAATDRFHVFGQIKNYVDLDISQGAIHVFGVKFYPWAVNQFWKIDMHYLTDQSVDLESLELKQIKTLSDKIINAKTLTSRIKAVEKYLLKHCSTNQNETLQTVFNRFDHNTSDLNLNNLNVSKRRLEQRFKTEIGISPHHYNKIIRINNIIDNLKQNQEDTLTQLALAHGFYDQSHCIKDFKMFTGYSPKQFLKSINPDGDILNLVAN